MALGRWLMDAADFLARANPSAAALAKIQPQPMTAGIAAENAVYAMASCNCYHQPTSKKIHFPIDLLGWQLVGPDGHATSDPTFADDEFGLAYDIYEHTQENETIFAFRGTDNRNDYLNASLGLAWYSPQYRAGRAAFVEYAKRNRNRRIVLTGHSLGGGLALSAAVRQDVAEQAGTSGYDCVVFDSSPRIFDGWGDHHTTSKRVLVYQDNEILESVRRLWLRKFYSVVDPNNVFETRYDFKGGDGKVRNAHRIDLLALGLLGEAAPLDANLKRVLDNTAHPEFPSGIGRIQPVQ